MPLPPPRTSLSREPRQRHTDRLVYDLYGLTDHEIQIVERVGACRADRRCDHRRFKEDWMAIRTNAAITRIGTRRTKAK